MRPSTHTNPEIKLSRLLRFEAFRSSLSEEDRRALDRKMNRWALALNPGRCYGFGETSARELFIALMDVCKFPCSQVRENG